MRINIIATVFAPQTLTSEDLDALLFAASVDSVGDAVNTEHFLKNCISLLPQYATHEGAPQAGSPANAGVRLAFSDCNSTI
jgi:hypothetical protein